MVYYPNRHNMHMDDSTMQYTTVGIKAQKALQSCVEGARGVDSKGRVRVYAKTYTKAWRPIAEAGNDYRKTSPWSARAAERAGHPEKICLHAEQLALLRSRGKIIHYLVVARVLKDDSIAGSMPCPVCQEFISEYEKLQGQEIELIYYV